MKTKTGKQLGPFLLSGLIIGPILGSGIIILPPLAHHVAGDWAIVAWALIAVAGFCFAFIFGRLSILYPGPSGVTKAISVAFGDRIKLLTSLYLIGAVLFGPVAVMLTAANYLAPGTQYPGILGGVILLICTALLFRDIKSIGRIGLILSSLAAATLVAGGIATLLSNSHPVPPLPEFQASSFGYCLLLLFWTIVGWEIIGNYSDEVANPPKSIMRAVIFSATIITVVSMTVAAAVQYGVVTGAGSRQITAIIQPLAGSWSAAIMGLLTLALCTTTYLMFAGGVARLIATLAAEGTLPQFLRRKSKSGAPATAIVGLTGVHLILLGLAQMRMVHTEILVSFADGFFLANAAIGLAAASKLMKSFILRFSIVLLGIFFLAVFLNSQPWVIMTIIFMAALVMLKKEDKPALDSQTSTSRYSLTTTNR